MAYNFREEFQDFDDHASCDALLALGWTDRSWRNEACPSFQDRCAYIMVDYLDPELAENGPDMDRAEYLAQRFQIGRCKEDGEDLGEWQNTATLEAALVVAAVFNAEAALA